MSPSLVIVVHDVSDPHDNGAGTEGDEYTDHHYHRHGDGPLVEIVSGGEEEEEEEREEEGGGGGGRGKRRSKRRRRMRRMRRREEEE